MNKVSENRRKPPNQRLPRRPMPISADRSRPAWPALDRPGCTVQPRLESRAESRQARTGDERHNALPALPGLDGLRSFPYRP